MDNNKIILASQSPRRAEILRMIGLSFKVEPSNIHEEMNQKIEQNEFAINISRAKAEKISHKYPNNIIIGADTIVVYNKKIFGKPKDKNESRKMLKALSGNCHKVITGVTIMSEKLSILKHLAKQQKFSLKKSPQNKLNFM